MAVNDLTPDELDAVTALPKVGVLGELRFVLLYGGGKPPESPVKDKTYAEFKKRFVALAAEIRKHRMLPVPCPEAEAVFGGKFSIAEMRELCVTLAARYGYDAVLDFDSEYALTPKITPSHAPKEANRAPGR